MNATLKTVMGYIGRGIKGRFGMASRAKSLDDIFNYLRLDDRLATSGQPTAEQFELIRDAGYEVVINLAPANAENALGNEDEVLVGLGLEYRHLPVIFMKPTRDDFECFVDALNGVGERKIWVHCAANMRVSAFFYKYRVDVLGWSPEDAKTDLNRIWKPIPVWQAFIDEA